jgi:hypothetical protein
MGMLEGRNFGKNADPHRRPVLIAIGYRARPTPLLARDRGGIRIAKTALGLSQ